MVGGDTGKVGLNVPRPVVEESLRGLENVTVHQPVVVDNARGMIDRQEIVRLMNVSHEYFYIYLICKYFPF